MATGSAFSKNQHFPRSSVETASTSSAINGFHSYNRFETQYEDGNIIPSFISGIIQELVNCSEDNQAMCGNCRSRIISVSRCHECPELLCQNCMYTHCNVRHMKNGFKKKHSIMCETHVNEKACFCCDSCGIFICGECYQKLHRGHTVAYIQEAVEKARTAARNLLSYAKSEATAVKEGLEKTQKMTDAVNKKFSIIAADIHTVSQQYILAIQKRERDLIKSLETVQMSKYSSLQQQLDYLQCSLVRLEQTEKSLFNALESGSTKELLWAKDKARGELDQLQAVNTTLVPHEDDYISFIQPDHSLLQAVATMGLIHSSACSLTTIANGEGLRRAAVNRVASFTIQVKDHLDQPRKNCRDVIEIRILEPHGSILRAELIDNCDGSYDVTYRPSIQGLHRIHISIRGREIRNSPFSVMTRQYRNYTKIANVLFTIGEEGVGDGQFCRPWGVCCDQEGNIIVADRSNNRIQIFSPNGIFLMKFGCSGSEPGQFNRPVGIDVDKVRSRLIVSDKDNHRIQVFTNKGQFLFMFGEKGEEVGQFSYPWDVAVNQEGLIAVADSRNHRVQLFAHDGSFLRKYGFETQANMWKHFDSPRGICFNPNGQINVTDFNNHRVVMIDSTFRNARFLGVEGSGVKQFSRPQGIVIDDEGHIIVADSKNSRIQVFERNGSFLKEFGVYGKLPGEFDRPSGICLSPDGKIIVVDFANHRIQVF